MRLTSAFSCNSQRSSSTASSRLTFLPLLSTLTFLLTLFVAPSQAGFDFKIIPDECPNVNMQISIGTSDGSMSAAGVNVTWAKSPPSGSIYSPPPFISEIVDLGTNALVYSGNNDKVWFFNYSLGPQYDDQLIHSVFVNATLLDANNAPLKNFLGFTYFKKTFMDPLCKTTGTGNSFPTLSGSFPGFVTPTTTGTNSGDMSDTGSNGGGGGGSGNKNKGKDIAVIVGLSLGIVGGIITIIVVAVVFWRKRQVKAGKRREINPYAADHMGSDAREWKPVN
ncbi:hypothetical protein OC846_004917 [Tilletia horrida]|uniref:Mid2 domain-containing protein n=1 Tax=Tilletia horrida TaxID=155126 RepID=A0AAN6JQQ6_9BASI|nr:hypothetical protein OC846_004917 [Tilletia horrida]